MAVKSNKLRSAAFRRISLPYCIQKMESDTYRHVWLPLNRNYKPLGVLTIEWVDYRDYIASALVFKRDPTKFKNVWDGSVTPTCCYLYNDGTDLDVVYFQALQRLLSHEHSYYATDDHRQRSWWLHKSYSFHDPHPLSLSQGRSPHR